MCIYREYIDGTVRFSLCYETSKEEIDYAVEKLKNYVETIRLLSGRNRRR